MSETWDGRPQDPERDGWHWLAGPNGVPACFHWNADRLTWWIPGPDECSAEATLRYATYLGPCLTPAEAQQIRLDALEEAARVADTWAAEAIREARTTLRALGAAIRALAGPPAPSP